MKRIAWMLTGLLAAGASPAGAHGLDAGRIGLQLEGTHLTLVATPAAAVLPGADRDGDGRLSITELQEGRAGLARELDRLIVVRDESGTAAMLTFGDVIVPVPDKSRTPGPALHVKILRKYRFARPPRTLRLASGLAARGGAPLVVVLRAEARPLQSAVLAPHQDEVAFTLAQPAATEVMGQWLRIGVLHVLAGADHLLLLALLLWGTWQWRYTAICLTVFTVGHSLTLLLVMGGVLLFPGWAEAAIAATIVATGLQQLYRVQNPAVTPEAAGRVQTGLVLLFGLVHGLGFAGAVRDTALASAQRWPTLVGFNIGIEAGQVLVALALWPVLDALRRAPAWMTQALLASATGAGLCWMVARL
ncbi:MAG TPA: HupE/UreJ family protein [Moraxellaceae bacterium]|nr:HupE/UreJ family protein [Moraxellaceae bacterium]